ncbi:hypothetical protein ACSAZL_17200 [Methanosarcina sp. T3]|uniref:hypothetical protein n=1 Tax=Methanosarcina sp. T3 TaxID=3439062 RepID=UPI003F863C9F
MAVSIFREVKNPEIISCSLKSSLSKRIWINKPAFWKDKSNSGNIEVLDIALVFRILFPFTPWRAFIGGAGEFVINS